MTGGKTHKPALSDFRPQGWQTAALRSERRPLLARQLQARKPRIDSASIDQRVVRALLDEQSAIDDKDAAGADDGGEPV